MKPSHFTIKLAGASAMLAFALTGCMRPDKDRFNSEGMNVMLKQEDANMGEVLNTSSTAAAKVGASIPDTFSGELNVSWSRGVNGAWIRTAEYIGTSGFERQRLDTIQLLDSSNNPLVYFQPALAKIITHARHITRTRNGKQVDIQINTTFHWNTDPVSGARTAGVWDGTIVGYFNGFPFKTGTGTISNVTRPFTPGVIHPFGYPTSGYVEVERLVYRVRLEFLGGSKADVTVTNTNNGTVYILHISATNVETQ